MSNFWGSEDDNIPHLLFFTFSSRLVCCLITRGYITVKEDSLNQSLIIIINIQYFQLYEIILSTSFWRKIMKGTYKLLLSTVLSLLSILLVGSLICCKAIWSDNNLPIPNESIQAPAEYAHIDEQVYTGRPIYA